MRLFSVLLTVLKSFKPSEKIKDVSSQNYIKPQNHTSSSAGVIEKRLCTRICGHNFFFLMMKWLWVGLWEEMEVQGRMLQI